MIKATKPRERIYLNFLPIPTITDGLCYTFFAIDEYSKFAFLLNTNKVLTLESLIMAVKELMQNDDFKTESQQPFTLVCNIGNEAKDQLDFIVRSYKGNILFDVDAVQTNTQDFINQFTKR